MSETAEIKIAEVSASEASLDKSLSRKVSIRVSPNNYLTVVFIATFFTGFLIYLELDLTAFIWFTASWLVMFILAWFDKITFDGQTISRRGIVPRLWNWVNGKYSKVSLAQIEQVETQAVRALKRGGKVFYRYSTSIHGGNRKFAFSSGGEDYRRMVRAIFPKLADDVLDNRSLELRDYLQEPKEVLMKAEFARIPSSDVLENSINEFQNLDRRLKSGRGVTEIAEKEISKVEDLRRLANELRLSGNLLQALEVFRRALLINPVDAWLLFDFARCLHSYAGAERSERLERRAKAVMRLAENRAGKDGDLLARLGESYFQYGEWERARQVFQKALSFAEDSFRSVRGLAEIALREGKVAHVIHHFASAMHYADTSALRRWAEVETEYFSRLNSDVGYMESEIRRINILDRLEKGKRFSLRLALVGMSTVLFGIILDPELTDIGWTLSALALFAWVGLMVSRNLLSERKRIVEAED